MWLLTDSMSHPLLLSSVVAAQWNGTSGGTYMWKMIEEDVRSRYLPGHGRLRLIVITDGEDTHSPGIEQTDTHARTREHTHTHTRTRTHDTRHTTHTHTHKVCCKSGYSRCSHLCFCGRCLLRHQGHGCIDEGQVDC